MSKPTSNPVSKVKKSVALSGVPAGNTAICTVGNTGNDLHYRGYDIAELAAHATFEEVAHLLIHERLPSRSELSAYQDRLIALRGIPPAVRAILEQLPASAHTMGVLRTACSALGAIDPERAAAGSARSGGSVLGAALFGYTTWCAFTPRPLR